MRLIDADAMRQEWLENGENEYVYDTNVILDSIDRQLTIDQEDLRPKGSWEFGVKRGASGYWCSNCESGFTGENAKWIAKEHDYCPKCGAKMEG